MKNIYLTKLIIAGFSLLGLSASYAEPRPNIVVFLADDMGWGDAACYGSEKIISPNIDKLASQGVRFTQAYAACGVCSSSRSAILTGRTPYRNGVWEHLSGKGPAHLRASEITYPKLLQQAGYATCHVGKWHLNSKQQFNNPEYPQPGHIEPGTVSSVPVIGSDIFTTVLEAAGVPIPTDRTIDGVSMVPAFAGKPVERKIPLFWRTHVSGPDSRVAVRMGDWKLVSNDTMDKFQLFNIVEDATEANNLAESMPEKLDELKKTLHTVWVGVQAEGPSEWWLEVKRKPKGNGTLAY